MLLDGVVTETIHFEVEPEGEKYSSSQQQEQEEQREELERQEERIQKDKNTKRIVKSKAAPNAVKVCFNRLCGNRCRMSRTKCASCPSLCSLLCVTVLFYVAGGTHTFYMLT